MIPGHHPCMSNETYHSGAGVSKSHLDVLAQGGLPAYWHAYINPLREPREATTAMILGSATHKAVLEPDDFAHEFVPEPVDAPKRPTKSQINAKKPSHDTIDLIAYWKDFDAETCGLTVLTRDQYDTAWEIAAAVHMHPKAGPWLQELIKQGAKPEQTYVGVDPDTGATVKCRFDLDGASEMVDLKTTQDASPAGFMHSVHKYRYGVQEAWYRKVYGLATGNEFDRWTFLAVQSTAPYQIGLYTLPRDYVAACGRIAEENLRAIVQAKQRDYWPDPGCSGIQELDVPGWVRKSAGVDSSTNDYEGLE